MMAKLDFTVGDYDRGTEVPSQLPCHYDILTQLQRRAVREEYYKRQRGLCPNCLQPLLGDPPPFIMRLPLDRRMFGANLEFIKQG
jgi:hypothetical protein